MNSLSRVLAAMAFALLLSVTTVFAESATEKDKPAVKEDKPVTVATEDKTTKDDKATKPAEPATPTPPTYTVKKEPFKIQVDLEGVFESQAMAELVLRPQEWTGMSVLEAVEHGEKVKKGDELVKLDTEKIDRAINDLRTELKLGEIAMKQSQEQLALLEKTTPMDLEAGQRAQRVAEEDLKFYKEIGRPLSLKSLEMGLKFAHKGLEYEKEELRQLEKMYKADDLTEETEKIVLQRQRDTVERSEWMLHTMEIQNEKELKFEIPRKDQQIEEGFRRRTLQWNKDRIELPQNLNKQRLEFERLKIQSERSAEKLKKLQADRDAMIVKAPIAGYVYYGRCQRGKFSEVATLAETLRRGGAIQPNQVFMTVVESQPLSLRANVTEEQLQNVYEGVSGVASPTGYPNLKWDAEVESVSVAPSTPGSFDARLSVSPGRPDKRIMPGMTCKIKLTPYSKSEAVAIPPKSVFSDPQNEEEKFVYVLDKAGKPEKRTVKVGKQTDKQAEILKGLNDGDKILLESPKDDK